MQQAEVAPKGVYFVTAGCAAGVSQHVESPQSPVGPIRLKVA